METSPPVDSSTSSEYDDDNEVSSGDDEICLTDDPFIFNNFNIVDRIGKGGFGIVYEVESKNDRRKFALKFVKFNLKTDLKVYREVQVLESLKHRNIIKYFEHWVAKLSFSNSTSKALEENDTSGNLNISFREDKIPVDDNKINVTYCKSINRIKSPEEEHISSYLVIQTELCQPKVNLQILIQSKKVINMRENERCNFFLQIVYGLQHIHDKRVIHRDLKPANILIGIDDQEAKIADFGLARVYEMSHADGNSSTSKTFTDALTSNIGTPAYVAPEVKRLTAYGYKADLYSLGIILSEMYLDMGPDRPRIIDRLRTQNFEDLKNIPNEVEEVIRSLLSYEPSMRMELERVIDTMSPLEQHQRVEVSVFYYICKKLKHCVYTYLLTFYCFKSNKNLKLKQYL